MSINVLNTPESVVSLVTPKLKITGNSGTPKLDLLTNFFEGLTTEEQSGDLVSFENTVGLPLPFVSVKADITAQQDLHGQANPYPAGGGKNKLHITATTATQNDVTFTVNSDGTISLSGTASADTNFMLNITQKLVEGTSYHISGIPASGNGSNYYLLSTRGLSAGNTTAGFGQSATATSEALYLFLHVSSGVNTNGVVVKPMICLATETDYTYAPYSNICQISGFSEVNVERFGKNILNPLVYNGGTYNPSIGATLNLTVAPSAKQWSVSEDKTTFTLSTTANNQTFTILYPLKFGNCYANVHIEGASKLRTSRLHLDKDFKVLSRVNNTDKSQTIKGEAIKNENDAWYAIVITNSTATTETITMTNPMVSLGSTDNPYEPYTGETESFTFGSTVYGGTLNVTTGVLTVTHAEVDLGTLNWGYSSADQRFYYNGLDYKRPSSATDVANAICDRYTVVKLGSLANNTICLYTNGYVYIKDLAYNDATALKTALSGSQLVYELETPTEIQLTPTEVKTLLGQNNIWADTGEVEVTYYTRG